MKMLVVLLTLGFVGAAQAQNLCKNSVQNALAKQAVGLSVNASVPQAQLDARAEDAEICYSLGNLETSINLFTFRYADVALNYPGLAGPVTEIGLASQTLVGFCSQMANDPSGQISRLPFGDRISLKNELVKLASSTQKVVSGIGCSADFNK